MCKSIKHKKEEEEHLELMVELDHILIVLAILKCSPVKKQKMLKNKLTKLKLLKLVKNKVLKLVKNDY